MRRKIFIVLLLISTLSIYGQETLNQLTSELKLEKIEFAKKGGSNIEESIFEDGTFNENVEIKNKVFKKVRLNYDQNKELQLISYYFKNKKAVEKNAKNIYNLLEKFYGKSDQDFHEFYSNRYKFDNADNEIILDPSFRYPEYSVLTIRKINIKVKEEYDEFSKITYLLPQNNTIFLKTKNDYELSVEFVGSIKGLEKKLLMKIGSQSEDWKFLEEVIVLTSDGKSESFTLATKREAEKNYGLTEEKTIFELPENIINKIKTVDDVKFRVKGKINYDFKLGNMQLENLKVIWGKISER
jgi:hypothetical protein